MWVFGGGFHGMELGGDSWKIPKRGSRAHYDVVAGPHDCVTKLLRGPSVKKSHCFSSAFERTEATIRSSKDPRTTRP
jgi:hypothetical protein